MNKIIIFTVCNGYTRQYFTNFAFNSNDLDIFEVENILFISDNYEEEDIENEKIKIQEFIGESKVFVFYHETAPFMPDQEKSIKKLISDDCLIEIYDHHNSDGDYFDYINRASNYYKENDKNSFYKEINCLMEYIINK